MSEQENNNPKSMADRLGIDTDRYTVKEFGDVKEAVRDQGVKNASTTDLVILLAGKGFETAMCIARARAKEGDTSVPPVALGSIMFAVQGAMFGSLLAKTAMPEKELDEVVTDLLASLRESITINFDSTRDQMRERGEI